MWKLENEDGDVAYVLIKSPSHEEMFVLLLVCAWTSGHREAKADCKT